MRGFLVLSFKQSSCNMVTSHFDKLPTHDNEHMEFWKFEWVSSGSFIFIRTRFPVSSYEFGLFLNLGRVLPK